MTICHFCLTTQRLKPGLFLGYGTAEAAPFHKTLKPYEQPLVLPQLPQR